MKPCRMKQQRRVGSASILIIAALLALIPPAAAQNAARIDLEAQTLFIDENPAEIVLRISGAPDTARLRFTIYGTVARTRARVRDHHENPPSTGNRIADFECTLDGDCFDQATMTIGPDGIRTVTLDDDAIGEALRRPVGVLPFVILLLDEDTILDELATSLVVLDDDPTTAGGPHPVRVAFTSQVIAPVALQPDLRTSLDTEALLATTNSLSSHPDLAVTTELRPETLDALATSDPGALDELLEILDGRPLLRGPWVDMDEEAWRLAGESDQVVSQDALGSDTLEEITGTPPTGVVRLDLDAGPDTLALLRSAGASTVLVDDEQLSARTLRAPPTQPFQLLDVNGVVITALRYDENLHDTLADDDPELAAYRAIAELAILAEEATTDQGVLLDLDRLDSETLVRLLEGIAERRSLSVTDLESLTQRQLVRLDGETLRGELVPTAAPDVTALAEDLESATLAVATIARMIEPEVGLVAPFVSQLQAAVAADLEPDDAQRYVDRINQEVDQLRSGIRIPDGDRITLTDRSTELRLTVVNPQPLPLNVELLLTAEKIRFPDGNRLDLVLDPGTNVIPIRVETLASGDARLTATVVSPGGFFELATGTVDIRSTAISGLGLLISIVALFVLAVWWIRTILRIRRNRVAATVSAESGEDTPTSEARPTEGES